MSGINKSFKVLFVFLFFLTGVYYCEPEIDKYENLKKEIQVKLDSIRVTAGFPGATLAFVLKDGIKLNFATGLSDVENEKEMLPDGRMFVGSTGKTYVSAVAMQLIDEGKLDLNEKVSKYFEGEDWYKRIPNYSEITIRMIMNHTGGIPRYVLKQTFNDALGASPDKVWKPEELLYYIFDDPPAHEPGKGWVYSDTDYIILGMIIEKICKNTYYNELKERILDPLKLHDTDPSDKRELKGLIVGYTAENQPPFNLPGKVGIDGVYPVNPQFEWTGGGLISTSPDLALWAKYLYESKAFSQQRLEEMLKPVNYRTGQPDEAGYGLGVFVWRTPQGKIYGHGGFFPGYETHIVYVPKYGCSAAMQVNTDFTTRKVASSLMRYIMQLLPLLEKHQGT